MMRWVAMVSLALLLGCGGAKSSETETPKTDEPARPATSRAPSPTAAHAMLRDYVRLLAHIKNGSGAELIQSLEELEARSSTAETFGTVSSEFARRFARLVQVTRLIVAPGGAGDGELSAFVSEVEGQPRQVDPNGGLAEVGPALAEEVIRLHMLAAGNEDRAAAEAAYAGTLESP